MNITNLIVQLQNKVNDLTYNQLAVAASIELLKTGQVNFSQSIAELPAASISNGCMYYVRGSGVYFSNGTIWQPIDITNFITQTTAHSWGLGTCGRLGDNTVANKSSPTTVVGGFTDWLQVSAGNIFALGVKRDGTAWAWGFNNCGQLGDNTVANKSSPVSVVGGFTDWCQISANYFSLGVRTNGTAWAWGSNYCGRLGDNTVTNRSSPVSVIGGFTDWRQLSAGGGHATGLRQNGTVWAWGCNSFGQLGDNTIVSKSSPVSVVGGFTDWCQVSAGERHSLAVRTNGTAWSWGCGSNGRLGDNTAVGKSSPVSVVGGFTNWCQLSAGLTHSVGVRTNGTAMAWGSNCCGQLGDGTTTSRSSPITVSGGFTDWCQLSAGTNFSLGARQIGTIWGWGINTSGQLGDNSITNRTAPVSVRTCCNCGDWCQVSAGGYFSLALRNFVDS